MASRGPKNDRELVQIVDAAVADAARRSGEWLVCRPGCTQCCIAPFPISDLDARRLRHGMAELERSDPARAQGIRTRAEEFVARFAAEFPGDAKTGALDPKREDEFAEFADEEPCPALDPETGLCDVYEWRPMTCRTFGPPLRTDEGGLGVCELCYHGATDEEIAACEVHLDPEALERALRKPAGEGAGATQDRQTIVAWALIRR